MRALKKGPNAAPGDAAIFIQIAMVIQLTLDATEDPVASIRQVDEAASERWGRR